MCCVSHRILEWKYSLNILIFFHLYKSSRKRQIVTYIDGFSFFFSAGEWFNQLESLSFLNIFTSYIYKSLLHSDFLKFLFIFTTIETWLTELQIAFGKFEIRLAGTWRSSQYRNDTADGTIKIRCGRWIRLDNNQWILLTLWYR